MMPTQWMRRRTPEWAGALVALASLALGVRAFIAGDVAAELSWFALGSCAFMFGRVLGTGRGWALWGVLALILSAALWWAVHPIVGVLAAAAAVAGALLARRALATRRASGRYLMHLAGALAKATKDRREPDEILSPLTGKLIPKDETRRGARVGLPVRWNVPADVPVDERARLLLTAAVAEVCRVPVTVRARRDHIDVHPAARPDTRTDQDRPEREQVERITEAIRPAMGPELAVSSTERDEDGELEAVTLTWPASYTNKAMSTAVRNRVGRSLSGVVGGAWQSAGWSTEERSATYRKMRELPRVIPHPGRDNGRPDRVPYATRRNGGAAYLSLGDENPHCLIGGSTTRGKTSLIRALLVGLPEAARAVLVDPKRASMLGLDQLPMVEKLTTRPETMAEAIRAFRQEMLDRYERLEAREVTVKQLQRLPRVLVVDEAEMLFDSLDDWWKLEEKEHVKEQHAARSKLKAELIKDQGQVDGETDVDKLPPLPSPSGTRHPATVWFKNILQAGRQAGMYVIMASQQNDASWLGTSARNQFGTRIALGNLDQIGSRQMFGTMGATSGLDSFKGRAWVGMGSGAIFPEQAQTWWVPELDPDASPEDRAILDRLGLVIPDDAALSEPTAPVGAPSGEKATGPGRVHAWEQPGRPEEGAGEPGAPEEGAGEPGAPEATPEPPAQRPDPRPDDPRDVARASLPADHEHEGASGQVTHEMVPENNEAGGRPDGQWEASPREGDRLDGDDDRHSAETEQVAALDLEEGDVLWLDLGEGELEPVEVVSVEVDSFDVERLEVTYRRGDDEAVEALHEDDPVQRTAR